MTKRTAMRAVFYQLCRAGEVFEVGDGPVALAGGPLLIGRGDPRESSAAEGTVLVDDAWMSQRHALVTPLERRVGGTDSALRASRADGPSRYLVEDAGSTNGILVNGQPTKKAPLLHGDLVETGRTFWMYVEEPASDPVLTEPFELGGVTTWTPAFARQLNLLSRQ